MQFRVAKFKNEKQEPLPVLPDDHNHYLQPLLQSSSSESGWPAVPWPALGKHH